MSRLRSFLVAFLIGLASALAQSDTTNAADSLDSGIRIGRSGARIRLDLLLPTTEHVLRLGAGYSVPSVHQSPLYSPALAMELDFGSIRARRLNRNSSVSELNATGVTVAALSPSLAFRDTTRVALEGWRFGFRFGSGHQLDSSGGLYLLHSGGWTWSYIRPSTAPTSGDSASVTNATAIADTYRSSHFGANTSATIGYRFDGTVVVEASYQRVLLYKNHAFFPWLGSLLLEGAAQSALGIALSGAEQRNPRAAAIAALVLRSALSWGIYQLRSTSGQHFPFGGNTPMLWDEIRIGIGLQF